MTCLSRICLAFAIIGALMIPTSAQGEYRFKFKHWYGQSFDFDGRTDTCVAALDNLDDQSLLIMLDTDFHLSMGVYDYRWNVEKGDTVPAEVWLDHSILYSGPAVSIFKDLYYLPLAQMARSLELMRGARMMLVQFKNQPMAFKLNGIGQALNALIACVEHEKDTHTVT